MSLASAEESIQPTSDVPYSALPINEESSRLSTFQDALLGFSGRDLARHGFFYNDLASSIECFSCSIRYRYPPQHERSSTSYAHAPSCAFDNGNVTRNVRITPFASIREPSRLNPRSRVLESVRNDDEDVDRVEVSSYTTLFPCDRPTHSGMRYLEDRLATFGGWPIGHTRCSVRSIAEAGFFFCGPVDKVICWYCGGGLEIWRYEDDPWFEHAKWHSQCNYLLQKKGIEYVDRVVQQNSHITRRPITSRGSDRNLVPTRPRHQSNINTRVEISSPAVVDRPPGIQIYPEPQWTRREVSLSGGGRQTIYRAPGMEVVTTRRPNSFSARREHIITQRSSLTEEDTGSHLVAGALEMGFSMEDIERAISRRNQLIGVRHSSVYELVNDLLSQDETFSLTRRSTESRIRELSSPSSSTTRQSSSNTQDQRPIDGEHEVVEELREVESGPERLPPEDESLASTSMGPPPGTCIVCEGRPVKTVFLPCSHMVACTTCGAWLRSCPLCNSDIERRINVRD